MARRPQEDPRVTDLRRYRKARELQRRQAPPGRSEPLLGSRPRARLILLIVALALAALWILPALRR
jgi:hypothetical protein